MGLTAPRLDDRITDLISLGQSARKNNEEAQHENSQAHETTSWRVRILRRDRRVRQALSYNIGRF
jgi:hypothetical protein